MGDMVSGILVMSCIALEKMYHEYVPNDLHGSNSARN